MKDRHYSHLAMDHHDRWHSRAVYGTAWMAPRFQRSDTQTDPQCQDQDGKKRKRPQMSLLDVQGSTPDSKGTGLVQTKFRSAQMCNQDPKHDGHTW